MKTLEDLYKEILADQDLKKQCAEAIKSGKLEEFLKENGCETTLEEVKAFLESKKEVVPDELDSVAGGCNDLPELLGSIFSVGIACIGLMIYSDCHPGAPNDFCPVA